ncbi:DUF1700 domain-containing protein [Sedimentibacter sp. zth1]|uniref:DUF1700 domain-containing protein n=1 Tax=Sedimentibacter sp. zth1 TaxID=2816908 RepID=UPI001A934718|nr:DUF1700 domain-containing protein [Sedimentibacter sp. zth1]QSX06590.1 DUF1700 domain-containing protein [Sedimentibacter sp. zth1]
MNKLEFLDILKSRISTLPSKEISKSEAYYSEIIDDSIENGLTEEQAILALGNIDNIVENIKYDMSIPALVQVKVNESRGNTSKTWLWITLTILGFPLWFPLVIAFSAVAFTIYLVLWVCILVLYIALFSIALTGISTFLFSFYIFVTQPIYIGLCLLGTSFVLIGLSIFLIKPVFLVSKYFAKLSKIIIRKIKKLFIGRRRQHEK